MNDHQQTVKKEIVFSGSGLFTGKEAVVRLLPAPPDTGIIFRRTDLSSAIPLAATLENVKVSPRCTLLEKEGVSVQTVEHLMAALRGMQVDNLFVEISGPEIPIFDGSALPFVQFFQQSGVLAQDKPRAVKKLSVPLSWSQGDVHLVALPADEFRISYTLYYPQSPYLRSQYFSYVLASESFCSEIAPCRTFTLYEDVAPLIEKGILKGGGLENGVVIRGNEVMNPEGVRFPDEMVRHKILDLIGDFSLTGMVFLAHIIAIRSGHSANHAFAKELVNHLRGS